MGVTPFLWFEEQAEEAARFYTPVFADSVIENIRHYGAAGPRAAGSVMTVTFTVRGQPFMALNGGPAFTFSPATSFVVNCETPAEVDRYWDALLAGGEAMPCGWLTDKFGVTWQIVPSVLNDLLSSDDAAVRDRVMSAMYAMKKLDGPALEAAGKRIS